jgi:hypothetical protein
VRCDPVPRATALSLLATCAVVLLARPGLGRAGICVDDAELDGYVDQLEAAAVRPARAARLSEYWRLCLEGDTRRQARIVAACTAIVARLDLATATGPVAACAPVLAAFGVNPVQTRTGEVDVVARLMAPATPPEQDPRTVLTTLGRSGDERVLPWLIERYRANVAVVAARPLRGWRASAWRMWNVGALALIVQQGGAAELVALDEMLAATRDAGLRRLVTRARARLAGRLKRVSAP